MMTQIAREARGVRNNPSPRRGTAIAFRPPGAIVAAVREGLRLHGAGYGGKGLRPETVAWARRIAHGEPVDLEKLGKMYGWLRRHGASPAEVARRRRDPTSPAAVAWALWGGDGALGWVRGKLARIGWSPGRPRGVGAARRRQGRS
jgi:hypothetical protein